MRGNLLLARLKLYRWVAKHRTSMVTVAGAAASTFLALSIEKQSFWWVAAFGLTSSAILFVSELPSRYSHLDLLESLLPIVHRALDLKDQDRVTLHWVVRKDKYEQFTNYYPTGLGRGRRYSFTHGIVGQALKIKMLVCWSVPAGTSFDQAMRDRWSFSAEELSRLTQDRRSFLAYPVMDRTGESRAVLYMDSPDPSRFNETKKSELESQITKWFKPMLDLFVSE